MYQCFSLKARYGSTATVGHLAESKGSENLFPIKQRSASHEFISPILPIENIQSPIKIRNSISADSQLNASCSSSDENLSLALGKRYSGKFCYLSGVHADLLPLSFDHNFVSVKTTTMASKHLPPIRELSQSKTLGKGCELKEESQSSENTLTGNPRVMISPDSVQPQIRTENLLSPAEIERQNRLRSRLLLSTISSCDLPDLNTTVTKNSLKPPFLIRAQDGSDTTSPLSSPSTSSHDDDEAKSVSLMSRGQYSSLPPSLRSSSNRNRRKPSKIGVAESTTTSDEVNAVPTMSNRRMPKKKSVSMASLVGSKESDSEDSKNLRASEVDRRLLYGHTTVMSHDSLNIPSALTKSRSLACLAAATMSISHPIMITEARARSFLVGSVGHTSMLGADELEKYFPGKKLRLFVGSWNMNGQTPPAYLADFLLPQNIEFVPDLLVIGTQECMGETKEWEARLQETLGASHVLFHSHSLGTLHLAIFIKRDLIWFCSVPEVDSFSTRPGANFKTKGAVAIAFILFGTSFLFVNCHLTAHQDNVQDRIKDLTKINSMLNLPKSLPIRRRHRNLADNFDVAFWSGDLNFRIDQTREVVIRDIKDGFSVLEFDQLNYLRHEGLIFNGYEEDPIRFLPTYKYDPGTNNFDTSSKQRVPAYTDRILYKSHKSTPITPLHYDIVQGVVTSDHKPVWGMWETLLRPGKDNVPLSGGLFNRDISLEGLKRRSEALKPLTKGKANLLAKM